MLDSVIAYLQSLQAEICQQCPIFEKQQDFHSDDWSYATGGGGKTCILSGGEVFERAGVNFSHVHGDKLPPTASALRPELAHHPFVATGISTVMHPLNPYVPTAHANSRFFMIELAHDKALWWFGGGFDLTPYYGFVADCQHWHQCAKTACDPFGATVYDEFKQWCDRYFFIKHRQEPRGIGGIFFDDLNAWGFSPCFAFIQAMGEQFLAAYFPIVQRRCQIPFSDRERQFQLYRRGRYVEFNLVYDRGTLFGLQSSGRVESILMSLPPQVRWQYDWQPPLHSAEAALCSTFLPIRDWLTVDSPVSRD